MRKVLKINRETCIGCGICVKACPACCLYVVDNKIQLIQEELCEGSGGCTIHCPVEAIKVVEKEAPVFNYKGVMNNIIKNGQHAVRLYLALCRQFNEVEKYQKFIEYLKEQNLEILPHNEDFTLYLDDEMRSLYYLNVAKEKL